jgi:hypothetical protein
VDNFINALNTTLLKSLNINKADSEIDEIDEVEVIEEHDEMNKKTWINRELIQMTRL